MSSKNQSLDDHLPEDSGMTNDDDKKKKKNDDNNNNGDKKKTHDGGPPPYVTTPRFSPSGSTIEEDVLSDEKHLLPPYKMTLSLLFLSLSFAVATTFAFAVGRACRNTVVGQTALGIIQNNNNNNSLYTNKADSKWGHTILPHPVLPDGKRVPSTIYTSKQFDTGVTTTSDSILLTRKPGSATKDETGHFFEAYEVSSDGTTSVTETTATVNNSNEEEEIHEPAGQHLLVDIENVDAHFLDSEELLAEAMMTLIDESGLTMLSYHCHGLEPMGVSCVGILLESHISFHTWPIPGAITLDLFTCGPNPLLPILPEIKRLFAIPSKAQVVNSTVKEPRVVWTFKRRGFRLEDKESNPEASELENYFLGSRSFDLKQLVASVQTDFQEVVIYDFIDRRLASLDAYQKSLLNDGSYESQHPQFFRPDRAVYLDNVMQSRLRGEAAYHETLVHPAMFAHWDPKRVAIIGGGEGATLREVLKHDTVEYVAMIEIDEVMAEVSRKYIPEWSDCSNIRGSVDSCFEDPRAEIFYEDAIAWFIERFGEAANIDNNYRFDVVIMDALDPNAVVAFSDALYDNDGLMFAISNSLTSEGILVAQTGEGEFFDDPPVEFTRSSVVGDGFITHLQKHGFEKVKDFSEELKGGFQAPWEYLIAFKDSFNNELWYANEATVSLAIRERIRPSIDGTPLLRVFDGATMKSLSYPSRIIQETFCRKVPTPFGCDDGQGLDPNVPAAVISSFEVKQSKIPGAGRGVFFLEHVPEGTYVAPDDCVADIIITPSTTRLIRSLEQNGFGMYWRTLDAYLFGYGFASEFYGPPSYTVDAGILMFINHGCNGSNVMGFTGVTEATADPNEMPRELNNTEYESAVYNPFIDRNHLMFLHGLDLTIVDVTAGDELKDNYLAYLQSENWAKGVFNYRSMCQDPHEGIVTRYEEGDEDAGDALHEEHGYSED